MQSSNITNVTEVRLAPGEFFFGGGMTRIHTLLGSCVAITLWHPTKQIGGMCHYVHSSRGHRQRFNQGHYADGAIELFLQAISKAQTFPRDYEVKLFGGGNMFESLGYKKGAANVAQNNIMIGQELLKEHGFSLIKASDFGGSDYRNIYFELESGDVRVRRGRSAITTQNLL